MWMRQEVQSLIMLAFEEGSTRYWILDTEKRWMKLKINIIVSSKFRDRVNFSGWKEHAKYFSKGT